MANGDVHLPAARRTTKRTAWVSLGLGVLLFDPSALGLLAGAAWGERVGPDYDHHMVNGQQRRLINRWGCLGWAWRFYWLPYDRANPHRGRAHTWPWGTLDRFAYGLWPFLLLSIVAGLVAPDPALIAFLIKWWAWVFLGQTVQDLVHLYYDYGLLGMLLKGYRK